MQNSCFGCPNRQVSCRSNCAYWKKHEEEKAERYNNNNLLRSIGVSVPKTVYSNFKLREEYNRVRDQIRGMVSDA